MNQGRKSKAELIAELSAAVRANQNATDNMDEAAARGMGVNRTDARCLDAIEQFGPMTAGRLAETAGLTTGAVTAVIDRLVAKGYLRRVPDRDDRRRVMVEVTEQMRRDGWHFYGPLAEGAKPFLARYSRSELELITNFFEGSTEAIERRAREIRAELAAEPKRR